jgi:hypothetical protein
VNEVSFAELHRSILKSKAVTTESNLTGQDQSIVLLQEAPLRDLLAAGMAGTVLVKGITGGFILEVTIGGRPAVLASARGSERLFASFETVGLLLRRMGLERFEVDVSKYEPGRIRAARPERSAAMKAGRLPEKAVKKNGNEPLIKGKK